MSCHCSYPLAAVRQSSWACSRRRRAPSFLQYGMPHKPERASPHHERKEWVLYGKGMGRHYCE